MLEALAEDAGDTRAEVVEAQVRAAVTDGV